MIVLPGALAALPVADVALALVACGSSKLTTANEWSRASGSCRPRATSFRAGFRRLGSTSAIAISTGASCGTASAQSRSRPSYRWASRSTPGCAAGHSPARRRSGDRIAIGAYLEGESFDRAIADFSERYADQKRARLRRSGRRDQVGPHRGSNRPAL